MSLLSQLQRYLYYYFSYKSENESKSVIKIAIFLSKVSFNGDSQNIIWVTPLRNINAQKSKSIAKVDLD